MIGVSVMSGCPVRCKFCATGQMKGFRNLTADEIVKQVEFMVKKDNFNPSESKEFKINYTRMGEPFLNIDAVKTAMSRIDKMFPNTHHYVSTIGIKDADYSWIKDNITLQLSIHSFDDESRNWLIPYKNKSTIEELGKIRTKSNLKTTINLTLVNESDFDINGLKKNFDKDKFFIKISPINPNVISEKNGMGNGIIKGKNLI
jgi:23S rRNA (adenine2503-C2)-methyltransferase